MRRSTFFAAASLVLAAPAVGHHSDAALDMDAVVAFEGTVTEFAWRNPHAYFAVETTDERGEPVEWSVQMGSSITISRRGWTRDSLSIGERVAVEVHPARDGRSYGMLESVIKEGGIRVPRGDYLPDAALRQAISVSKEGGTPVPAPTARTTSLEGRWIVDRDSRGPNYPGGLDQLMNRDLTLTGKGSAAKAGFSQNSEDNPELACMTKPTPGGIIYTDLYPMEIAFNEAEETITIRSQYFDQVRTVYMDGRTHAEAGERTHEGHSIGSWEGDVLIVDTANFADNVSPYQNGIPSGAQKHVVERYELGADGTRLTVEFMLEDPEFILGSMTHTRDLLYAPHMQMTPFNCDLEATRRYLPQ